MEAKIFTSARFILAFDDISDTAILIKKLDLSNFLT